MADITATLLAFKSAYDTAKTLVEIRDATKLNFTVLGLQRDLLALQASYTEAADRIRDLEKQIVQMKNWERETQRYRLHDYGGGSFAYALKEDVQPQEPPHRLCANCYAKGEKSILQFDKQTYDHRELWTCPRCANVFKFGHPRR